MINCVCNRNKSLVVCFQNYVRPFKTRNSCRIVNLIITLILTNNVSAGTRNGFENH